MGSAHFLVVAFDLMVQLYAEERKLAELGRIPADWAVPESKVAVTILEHNLHGIDIDPRAVQLATLALYLKAKEYQQRLGEELGRKELGFRGEDSGSGDLNPKSYSLNPNFHIHIVAADASFLQGQAWERFVAGFEQEPGMRRVLEALAGSLAHVRELGSLLRPEVELREIVAEERRKWVVEVGHGVEQPYLFPEFQGPHQARLPFEDITDEAFWERMAYKVEAAIRGFVDTARARGEIVERVVAGEAQRGFAFLDLLSRRYDVVCTNPPYMGSKNMGEVVKEYVARHYAPGKRDLYAAFILRCRELAQEDGHVAMVTQQSWMFLRSFADLRALPEEKLEKVGKGQFRGLLHDTSIETLGHLGPYAFSEISGAVVNTVLFTLRTVPATFEHQIVAFRLVAYKSSIEKAMALVDSGVTGNGVRFVPVQSKLAQLPMAVMAYWLTGYLAEILTANPRLGTVAYSRAGLMTGDAPRFIRFFWELSDLSDWLLLAHSGSYRKWTGRQQSYLCWDQVTRHILETVGNHLPSRDLYGRSLLAISQAAQGALGARYMQGAAFTNTSVVVIPIEETRIDGIAGLINSRISSFLVRILSQKIGFEPKHLDILPLPLTGKIDSSVEICSRWARSIKESLVNLELDERTFIDTLGFKDTACVQKIEAFLLMVEGAIEEFSFLSFSIALPDIQIILDETGTPAGWYPLVTGYDTLPETSDLTLESPILIQELLDYFAAHPRLSPAPQELAAIKDRLRAFYTAGPGAKQDLGARDQDLATEEQDISEIEPDAGDDDLNPNSYILDPNSSLGARVPIPTETFLEELAQKMELHPISVYWLLEEMRREEGLVCPPELKRHTEDYFSVKLLRMLGHRWPMQDQYEQEQGKPFMDAGWIDEDGILPLAPGTGEETLIERVRRFLDEEFGSQQGPSVEIEAGQILGWRPGDDWGKQKALPLARWFEREFFKRHVSQFKRRPIAWHLSSARGTFQVIVYYHKFDRNRLTLLRARYVREMLDSLRKQLAQAQVAGTDRKSLAAVADLEAKIADVQDFDERLRRLLEGRQAEARIWCPWKAAEEQPVGWEPDINDGVRVNIAPVQRLGLLAADVLASKDVKSLLAPEGRV